jgi:hypothetical protein
MKKQHFHGNLQKKNLNTLSPPVARQFLNKKHGLLPLDDVTEIWRVIVKIKLNCDALCWPHNSKEMTIMNCLCTVSTVQVLSTNFSVTFNNPGQPVFRICACADRFTAHSTIPKAIYRELRVAVH